MPDERPNPDLLLARVQAEEAKALRGKLKIFFGASPGVGKTYSMLEAGRKVAKEGVNVLVGYVEPHVRPETAALVLGLDVLARREVEYRGKRLVEFDLEAALAQRPQLLLVDELAHTNAPGLTHAKRWQDVEQLLAAGIDVYTTLNVQHLESLNDVIAQITGVVVRETVPDSVFEQADEVELVDLAPDDLVERLREGKVYLSDQAQTAIENFFRMGNLIALRELALRRMAERVEAQMVDYRVANVVSRIWPAADRLLVCVGPSPNSARLVRAARRMAASLRAAWIVGHVETPGDARLSQGDRDRLAETLHLAEQLGAETVTLSGTNFADEVLQYARCRNVTKIVVGKPSHPRWHELIRGSYVYELTRKCGDIDVYVISGEAEAKTSPASGRRHVRFSALRYLWAIAIVVLCTAVSWLAHPHVAEANLIMIYLLGVVAASLWCGRGPSVLATVLSVVAFDVYFVPPFYRLDVANTQYLFTFAVMLTTGLVISVLTARVTFQAESARQRERRTVALYAMSRQLANATTIADLLQAAQRHVGEAFDADIFLLRPTQGTPRPGPLKPVASGIAPPILDDHDLGAAQWVFEHGGIAGHGTDTLPSASAIVVPLATAERSSGVLGIRPKDSMRILAPDQIRLLQTFAGQIALSLERIQATEEARAFHVQMETERMRSSLLSTVSHDLRTPLAVIAGASSTLLDSDATLDAAARSELAESIYLEADRLSCLVSNLLDMTRLEAGALVVRKEWHPLEEIVGAALNRLSFQLKDREVFARFPSDLPLVPLDGLLIQQVLLNLLENSLYASPPSAPIELSASATDDRVTVEVADRGPGIPPAELDRIFEKFHRSGGAPRASGAGLGLAICRGIVELHGGRIWAENRVGDGAVFRFTLPLEGKPPDVLPATSVTQVNSKPPFPSEGRGRPGGSPEAR